MQTPAEADRRKLYASLLAGRTKSDDPVVNACVAQAIEVKVEGDALLTERDQLRATLADTETRLTAMAGKMDVLLEMAAKIVSRTPKA